MPVCKRDFLPCVKFDSSQSQATRQRQHPSCVLQTDKQRIIWAYKILFLDVLFPLNLRKVIFTDSDQIIRADFADLWNMDLQVTFPQPLYLASIS